MSNTDTAPAEVTCATSAFTGVLHAREVPLGGPRALLVRRTLPQRERSLIGAWCFADHYGPHDVRASGRGMDVPPHPHTGLQTVSWLFAGEIEHRDSAGVHAMVRPGELNLEAGAVLTLDVDPAYEHGVLLDQGIVHVGDTPLEVADLAYQAPGHQLLHLANPADSPARVVLLGGPPFPEELVMWWNFVGRSHDDIAMYRELWQDNDARFGDVSGYRGNTARLPAPPLPNGRLKPRPRPSN
ncbi:pirin family protein [Mycolicibacterium wolinskyi]|uniref:Pirin N-terminal domain-containing protein n=1 Tax=Mycolicibacterium wolinskyi TaxID=59750 RepID=A0A1X2FFU9_9MYCO|nr:MULTISPECIES: pirin family protein [Mycolicibacterium]MCV7288920.1 pirin family protein [Mycolicibacterium wolinskyi]MCV7296957.1 pirin family protein [Mycolicibacterium goodii]ORX17316.1 hypothetical protein AWC31_18460 [Mycolicibacterium wolinskyi]